MAVWLLTVQKLNAGHGLVGPYCLNSDMRCWVCNLETVPLMSGSSTTTMKKKKAEALVQSHLSRNSP